MVEERTLSLKQLAAEINRTYQQIIDDERKSIDYATEIGEMLIANLCLAAYRRLVARGKFIQPRSSSELEQRVLAGISPLAEFMQDNWVKDDQAEGPTCEAFYKVFVQWCMTTGHAQLARSYPRQKLGRAIADLDEWSWLKSGGRTTESGRKRRYPGIRRKTEDE